MPHPCHAQAPGKGLAEAQARWEQLPLSCSLPRCRHSLQSMGRGAQERVRHSTGGQSEDSGDTGGREDNPGEVRGQRPVTLAQRPEAGVERTRADPGSKKWASQVGSGAGLRRAPQGMSAQPQDLTFPSSACSHQ